MKRLIEQFNRWPWETRLLALFAVLSLVPAFASLWWPSHSGRSGESRPAAPSVDTQIPKGFVLIPIEVENYEAVDSILGRFGFVDLFQAADSGHVKKPVATNVRMIRAPQNPSQFAILVPESQASRLIAQNGPFGVVVKRPSDHGTEFVKEKTVTRRKIVYEGG